MLNALIEDHTKADAEEFNNLDCAATRALYTYGLEIIFAGWDEIDAISQIGRNWDRYAIPVKVTIEDPPQTH